MSASLARVLLQAADSDNDGVMAMGADPLNSAGFSHDGKMAYWRVYVLFNALGCALCAVLMAAVARLPMRSASDVLAAGLSFSCFVMSCTCGVQCLLNVAGGRFVYGNAACYAEAFFHVISILTMFAVLTLMAFDSYRTVVKGESIGVTRALIGMGIGWAGSAAGVGLFSLGSPIYMSPSGVFCFFQFDSLVMSAFFLPIFVGTAVAMLYFYCKIFSLTRDALKRMGTHLNVRESRRQIQMRLAQKLFLFVLVFLAGWILLVLGILLQIISGNMQQLDAIGGVAGVVHSLAVPIVYGLINPRLRLSMIAIMTCGLSRKWSDSKDSRGSHTETTVDATSKQDMVKGGSAYRKDSAAEQSTVTALPKGDAGAVSPTRATEKHSVAGSVAVRSGASSPLGRSNSLYGSPQLSTRTPLVVPLISRSPLASPSRIVEKSSASSAL